ncbi:hypothetical protein LTR17_015713 [Elasticomyces elasticus]|nr:hypothetical protein LTR17_015713 [Elasticomyces elasticus]
MALTWAHKTHETDTDHPQATITEQPSQAHTVLDLPELLETIILTLSMREMQRCRQVSKQWKATIDSSPSIRKALFLEPGTADDLAHDAQILKADPDFFHSGAQNGVSHYAVHPLFVSGWPSINSIPVEHLQKQATRLPGVFLTQPSRLTRGTRLWVCEPTSDWIDWQLQSKGAFVELQCDETFDDLGSKLEEVMQAHKMNPAFVEYHWSGAWRSGRVL